jgi:hypothetical protein
LDSVQRFDYSLEQTTKPFLDKVERHLSNTPWVFHSVAP